MENFLSLGLPQPLLHTLEKMKFTKPTPIQQMAIPLALAGRDILGSAQTGTGKTGAFAIPLIMHLINRPNSMALVMTPTRELAAQVIAAIDQMLPPSSGIRAALLIGGESMFKQRQQLQRRPRIIVGTPGRINDHLGERTLKLAAADFLVLDETDRMLDMGFEVQIDRIAKHLPQVRQTLLFSATLPPHILKVSQRFLKNAERVAVGSTHTPIERIKQELIKVNAADKYGTLIAQLELRKGSVIVFVRTKHGADKMAKKLNAQGHNSQAIHGNLNQNQRNRVIQSFRDKKCRIMVATDVASRGLDIPHIEHVINYDLPQVPEDYIHRIGRTARAGAEGSAVCFITPEDAEMWRDIYHLMNPTAKIEKLPQGGGFGEGRRNYGRQQQKPQDRQQRHNSVQARRRLRGEDERPQQGGQRRDGDTHQRRDGGHQGGQRPEGQGQRRDFSQRREGGQGQGQRRDGGNHPRREGGNGQGGGQGQRRQGHFRGQKAA